MGFNSSLNPFPIYQVVGDENVSLLDYFKAYAERSSVILIEIKNTQSIAVSILLIFFLAFESLSLQYCFELCIYNC
jgi:hypothetical protein